MPEVTDDRAAVHSAAAAAAAAFAQRKPYICDPNLAFVTPQLKKMLQAWELKRGARIMPCRADFGLRDLRFALPNVAVVALVREAARTRFQVCLMGTQLETYVGPLTGKFIDESLPKAIAEKWSSLLSIAAETRRATRSAGQVEVGGKNQYVFEKFCAPLADDGEHPDRLLIATYFHIWRSTEIEREDHTQTLLNEIGIVG